MKLKLYYSKMQLNEIESPKIVYPRIFLFLLYLLLNCYETRIATVRLNLKHSLIVFFFAIVIQ